MGKSNYNGITLKSLQPMFALVVNLVLAYLVYFVARIAFLFENYFFFQGGVRYFAFVAIVSWRINVRYQCDSLF